MRERKDVKVEVDAGEIVPAQVWETDRRVIDKHGARHIGDGYGIISLAVGGESVVQTHMHEDENGKTVLDVLLPHIEKSQRIRVEQLGLVPSRSGVKKVE